MKRDAVATYAVASNTPAVRVQNPATNKTRSNEGVWLSAPAANTAPVYIGGVDVTTANGFEMAAGDKIFLSIDPAELWVISAAAQSLRVLIV